jgi:dienelactone hydrolase
MVLAYPIGIAGDGALDTLSSISAPILGLVGRNDALVSVDDVMAARAAAPHSEWVLYDGAEHDFLDDSTAHYDTATATDALERISDFFEKHLPH